MTDRTVPQVGAPKLVVSIGRLRVDSAMSRWERADLPAAVAAALEQHYADAADPRHGPAPGAAVADRLAAAVHRALPRDLWGGAP